jgi:hypothetical protein
MMTIALFLARAGFVLSYSRKNGGAAGIAPTTPPYPME